MTSPARLARWLTIGTAVLSYAGLTQTAAAQAPANDNFAAAAVIDGPSTVLSFTTDGATKEAGEPRHAGNAGGASLWWRWTAPASGSVIVAVCTVNIDTLLAVYAGASVGALTTVASSDDACAGPIGGSQLTFAATVGVTYAIAVDGYDGATGGGLLNLSSLEPPPANDNFAAATPLSGSAATAAATNSAASREVGEPPHDGLPAAASVWWRWTAPFAGTTTIQTCGSSFAPVVDVYRGARLDALTSIVSSEVLCAGSLGSVAKFAAVAGESYSVAVDGVEGESGQIALRLDLAAPPPPPPPPAPPPPPPPVPPPPPPPIPQPGCALVGNVIVGSGGNDARTGTAGIDIIFGRAGNDVLRGAGAGDCLYGEAGADRLSGDASGDRLFGGAGADRLDGGSGSDRLDGQGGDDLLTGGPGADRLAGGAGRDRIQARDRQRDTITCGPGRDRVTADRRDRVARDCERVKRR